MYLFQSKTLIARIYYNQLEWNILITDFLAHYINKNKEAFLMKDWSISFSQNLGEHIILEIITTGDIKKLKSQLYKECIVFLENHQSITKEKSILENRYFINFPNNSIWFNKKEVLPVLFKSLNPKNIISKIIVNSFSKETINKARIITLIFYLQLCTLKAFDLKLEQLNKFICDEIDVEEQNKNNIKIQLESIKSNEIFQEILNDVFYLDPKEEELKWMYEWYMFCRANINHSNFIESYTNLCLIFINQLGFTKNIFLQTNRTIYFIIKEILDRR